METVVTQLQPETKALEGAEPMDRMKAEVTFYEERHGYGFKAVVQVWVPCSENTLAGVKANAIELARQFMAAAAVHD